VAISVFKNAWRIKPVRHHPWCSRCDANATIVADSPDKCRDFAAGMVVKHEHAWRSFSKLAKPTQGALDGETM
jgi:hypothetical protein